VTEQAGRLAEKGRAQAQGSRRESRANVDEQAQHGRERRGPPNKRPLSPRRTPHVRLPSCRVPNRLDPALLARACARADAGRAAQRSEPYVRPRRTAGRKRLLALSCALFHVGLPAARAVLHAAFASPWAREIELLEAAVSLALRLNSCLVGPARAPGLAFRTALRAATRGASSLEQHKQCVARTPRRRLWTPTSAGQPERLRAEEMGGNCLSQCARRGPQRARRSRTAAQRLRRPQQHTRAALLQRTSCPVALPRRLLRLLRLPLLPEGGNSAPTG
jgi:hypothetical protein